MKSGSDNSMLQRSQDCLSPRVSVIPRKPLRQSLCRALTDKGKSVRPGDIQVKSPLGQGSYGEVFEGWLKTPQGGERVVLKRVKDKVEGAAEMGEMEHLLNVYASKAAKNSVANYVGFAQVEPHQATRKLTQGLWLMWRYEGSRTLGHFLQRRDCIERLAEDLKVDETVVVPTVLRQIFESLAGMHGAGLVHRDVKPTNIIFSEEERRFKLIDLGACADLRTGTNYVPDESILDPTYCPPEQYCMPTDSPHLAKQMKPLAVAMSPLLWSRFKPDRFDSYSTGLVMMQLAVPRLRSASAIKAFNQQFRRCGHDLRTWRDSERLSPRDTQVLDANGGLGWDLAGALLRPRDIQVDDRGGVVFTNRNGAIRMPVKAAMRHSFMKQAVAVPRPDEQQSGSRKWWQGTGSKKRSVPVEAEPASEGTGLLSSALGFWRSAGRKMKDLEDKLSNQGKAVEYQTGKVVKLQQKYSQGQVAKEELERQQGLLGKMTGRLDKLQNEFSGVAANLRKVQSFLAPKEKSSTQEQSLQSEGSSKASPRPRGYEEDIAEAEPAPQPSGGLFSSFMRASNRPESNSAVVEEQGGSRTARSGSGSVKARVSDGDSGSSKTKTGTGSVRRRGFSLFGGGRDADPQDSAPPKEYQRPPATPSGRVRGSAGGRQQQNEASKQPASLGQTAQGAAVGGIYAGLRLTGLALRVAKDVATSIGKDMEQSLAAKEAQRQAKKKEAASMRSFLQLLGGCEQVRPSSTWSDVRRFLAKDPRFQSIPDEERRAEIFAQYTEELRDAEDARVRRGEQAFKELLSEVGLERGSALKDMRARWEQDERFSSLPDGVQVDRIFAETMEARAPEFDFLDLLRECRDPPLSATTTWGQARRQISGDRRFDVIPEQQRRAIFARFAASIEASEEADASPLPVAQTAASGGAASGKSAVEASQESLESLKAIRAEQARLREEYEKMEAKLRAIEERSSNDGPSNGVYKNNVNIPALWDRR